MIQLLVLFFSILICGGPAFSDLVERETEIPVKIMDKEYAFKLVAVYDDKMDLENAVTVLVFHGTGGSLPLDAAKAYAEKGFVGVAIHYFDYNPNYTPGKRPYTLIQVPLEGFEASIQWAKNLTGDGGKLVLDGRSRGGSLVLLLGHYFSDSLSGIIAEVPSLYAWGERATGNWSPKLPIETLPIGEVEGPSWTYKGKGLPFIPMNRFLQELSDEEEWNGLPLFNYETGFRRALEEAKSAGFAESARIPVENIPVPLLVTGGMMDGAWASGEAALSIKELRGKSIHGNHDIYVIEDAGHMWSSEDTFFPFPDGGYNRIINSETCKNLDAIEYEGHRTDIQGICLKSSEKELSEGVYYAAPEWARMNYEGFDNKAAFEKFIVAKEKFFNHLMNEGGSGSVDCHSPR